jgi:lipid II:glycine glycyltransferase (peptidoglycan interpeptide bridge formation enzyme)
MGMKPKTRYNINLAQRKGVVIKEGGQAQLLDFFKLMLETAKRNQFKLHSQNYYLQMWDHLAPSSFKLLLAYYNKQLLSGMLLSIFGDTATYLHGGTSLKLKETMAPYLLHWEAIKIAKQLNLKTYDFGGISPNNQSNHAWAGISRFKKSFGGFEVIYPGAYDLIYSPIWYNVYKNARLIRNLIR